MVYDSITMDGDTVPSSSWEDLHFINSQGCGRAMNVEFKDLSQLSTREIWSRSGSTCISSSLNINHRIVAYTSFCSCNYTHFVVTMATENTQWKNNKINTWPCWEWFLYEEVELLVSGHKQFPYFEIGAYWKNWLVSFMNWSWWCVKGFRKWTLLTVLPWNSLA